jgi:hypothetical protein
MKVVKVNSAELTSDCWMIQLRGLEACEECGYKGTSKCGGKAIIKRIGEERYPATGIGTNQ